MGAWLPTDRAEKLQICRELLSEASRDGFLPNAAVHVPAVCNDLDDSIMRLKREKGDEDAKQKPETG